MKDLRRRWRKYGELWVGLGIVAIFILVAAAAPRLSPAQESLDTFGQPIPASVLFVDQDSALPQPPGPQTPLGTTGGRIDLFHALVWGARDALRFGLLVGLSAAAFGVLVGTVSGYAGGWLGWLIMRVTDCFLTFPLIAAVVLANTLRDFFFYQASGGFDRLTAIVQGRPLPEFPLAFHVIFSFEMTVILFSWMIYARLIHALVVRLKSAEYIEASRALGAGGRHVIFKHLIPNVIAPALVLLSRDIGGLVLIQSALTFVHIGGNSVWGDVLVAGKDWIIGQGGNPFHYWWVFVPVSLAIILFGVGWSLVGDGLNELLNPRRAI